MLPAREVQKKLDAMRERFVFDRSMRGRKALAEVMKTQAGCDALFWILDQSGIYAPELWHPVAAELGKRAAVRDFGQRILDELVLANEPAFFDLQRNFRARAMEERLELENEERKLKDQIA